MRALIRLSDGLARVERVVVAALVAAVVGLILLNVVTRAFDSAIYWVDELAIYCMIWLVFVGGAHVLRLDKHVRVTVGLMALPRRARALALIAIDILLALFCLSLIWMAWIWYDPAGLARAGFDLEAFSGATFNFIYEEPTLTIGIDKFWVWLVMPWFALAASVHATANLVDRLQGRASVDAS